MLESDFNIPFAMSQFPELYDTCIIVTTFCSGLTLNLMSTVTKNILDVFSLFHSLFLNNTDFNNIWSLPGIKLPVTTKYC